MQALYGDGLKPGLGTTLALVIVIVIVVLVFLGVWSTSAAQEPSTLRALYGLSPPKALRAPQTAVLLVDFQDEFVHGGLPLPAARAAIGRAAELAAWAHRSGILVVRVHNVSARPGSPLFRRGAAATAFVPSSRRSRGTWWSRSRSSERSRARTWTPSCGPAASTP